LIEASPKRALADIAGWLTKRGIRFALVGGLAVSIRAEVRFTRDVDLALMVTEEALESLVRDLRATGYAIHAVLEHEVAKRTATVRLVTRDAINVDLLAASCGIEPEIVAAAEPIEIPGIGRVPIARAEDLLAMKVLSMTNRRLQDRDDAMKLVLTNESLDLDLVRARLLLVEERGFARGQDLMSKLAEVLSGV